MAQQVVKFKKPFQFKSATAIFAVLSVYLIFLIIAFALNKHTSTYEVKTGNLASYYTYTALALRSERIVKSSSNGYINFFAEEGRKASAKTLVYSLSNEKYSVIPDSSIKTEDILTAKRLSRIAERLESYSYEYSDTNFSNVYGLKDSLNSMYMEGVADVNKSGKLIPGMSAYYAYEPGVVIYSVDGMEELNVNTFTEDDLNGVNHTSKAVLNGEYINVGDTVYKVITSETWFLACKIDKELKNLLKEKSYVKIKFKKDNFRMEVPFTIDERDGAIFLILELNSGMIRYASDRYLDINLDIETVSGYKIPNSSILEVAFYEIDEEYMTKGGNSDSLGVLLSVVDSKTKKESVKFIPVGIYYHDEENKKYYIHDTRIDKGDEIVRPNSNERSILDKDRTFTCVYCVNKGYAYLKLVDVLTNNEDYSIIARGTRFGLSAYDHIVLDSKKITEGELIN